MIILAHRGIWNSPAEKNSATAIQHACDAGYGLEFDIRDSGRNLVVSHDIPADRVLPLNEVGATLQSFKSTIAFNIKSDGLTSKLKSFLDLLKIQNYFCFDMSIPETYSYHCKGINFFTHISDIQSNPVLIDSPLCKGIWLDSFHSIWYDLEILLHFQKQYCLPFCFVSEDLHGRDNSFQWSLLRKFNKKSGFDNLLCTDLPKQANDFFNNNLRFIDD